MAGRQGVDPHRVLQVQPDACPEVIDAAFGVLREMVLRSGADDAPRRLAELMAAHRHLRSNDATLSPVKTIAQRELRNRISEILREAEAGERFVVTVSGRPVAELGPPQRRRWVTPEQIDGLFVLPEPVGMMEDIEAPDTELEDPFERWDPKAP